MRLKILAGCALAFVMAAAANASTTITMSGTTLSSGIGGTGDTFTATMTYDDKASKTGGSSNNNGANAYYTAITAMTFVSGSYSSSLTLSNSPYQQFGVFDTNNSSYNDTITGYLQQANYAFLEAQFAGAYTTLNSTSIVDPSVAFATSIANSNLNQFYAYDGARNYSGTITSATSSASAVPEPASWLMMIGGFGLIGAAMRRQRKVAVICG